ncbi:hypothetical protein FQR65_LT18597 [Abscondita terminalis]|nr:hypothetical protein FQR65_LT18597 [Abscondita terminalis]
MVMLQNTKAKKKTYALKTLADYHGKILESDFNGMLLNFNGKEFWTSLTGRFNVYNLLLVFGIAVELGIEEDYAHTPDALENVLKTINDIRTKNERLICVFGCGGDRDHSKRPEMGDIATKNATLAIITSDNPRTEDPLTIIKEIEAGGSATELQSKYLSVSG